MGFFKEYKGDLSQAVNELKDQYQSLKEEDDEDQMVNTLDEDEMDSVSPLSDKDEKVPGETLNDTKEENTNDNTGIEGEEMEDASLFDDGNVDKEYLAQMLEEENLKEETNDEALNKETKNANVPDEKKEDDKAESKADVTVITKGTLINGSITSDGSLEVMGTITGDIECLGKLSIIGTVKGNSMASEIYVNTARLEGSLNSEGSVKVGVGTVVLGDVTASSAVIAGAIKGEVDINGPIVVDSTAIVKGNIKAKSVQINNGAVIDGYCSLSYAAVDIDNFFEEEKE